MKAVVVEVKDKSMIVVDQNGSFHQLKFDGMSKIGDEIKFINRKTNTLIYFKKLSAIAAMLLLVLGSSYGVWSYYFPYAYVDIDINPSLELVLNRYMRVIDVEKLNQDGDKVVANVSDFKHKNMEQAIEKLLNNAKEQKFFIENDDNAVMYTVSSINDKMLPDMKQKLKKVTQKRLTKAIKEENILIEDISLNKRNDAKKLNVSPGRIILLEKLKTVKPDAKIEDVQKKPIRETVKLIKEYREIRKELKEKINLEEKSDEEIVQLIEKQREIKNKLRENIQKQSIKGTGSNNLNKEQKDKLIIDQLNENSMNNNKISQKDKTQKNQEVKQKIKEKAENQIKNNNTESKIKERIKNINRIKSSQKPVLKREGE